METSDLPSPPTCDSATIEEFLRANDPHILAQARKEIPRSIGSSDSDDLAQSVRIKIWLAWQKRAITNPKPYINQISYHETVNIFRKEKSDQSLNTDDDGELDRGNVLVTPSMDFADPLEILEQREALAERLNKLIDALAKLYPRQRLVTLCRLTEGVDDELKEVLAENDIDTDIQWPEEKADRQLLKASYSAARHNIARYMNVDLSLYE